MVDVVLYGPVRETVGQKTVSADGDTVRAVLSALFAEHPGLETAIREGDEFRSEVNVLVDGRKIAAYDGIDTVLDGDQTVQITAAMSGGGR